MYDIEKITKIISDINRYKKELNGFEINSKKDLEDLQKYHASSMLCFAILNRIIDLGQEILIKENYGMPSRYSEIFDKLAKIGVLNKKEAGEVNRLIQYRNIIAHTYFDISEEDLWRIIKKLKVVDIIIKRVKKRIKK